MLVVVGVAVGVDGTVKSCVLAVVPLAAVVIAGVVSVAVIVAAGVDALTAVLDGVTKLMLPDARLADVIAALFDVGAAPSDANCPEDPAEGLEPLLTEKLAEPLLDSSHGAPDAGDPPFKVMPMT